MNDPRFLRMSSFLVDYPFAERLYPEAIEVVRHLDALGRAVILSDGDVVFQPRKVQQSGLWDAVNGRVLIYVRKEQMLGAVERLHPAAHYVMIDDKLRILAAMKAIWGNRLTTVFPRQGLIQIKNTKANLRALCRMHGRHIARRFLWQSRNARCRMNRGRR